MAYATPTEVIGASDRSKQEFDAVFELDESDSFIAHLHPTTTTITTLTITAN